MLALLAVTIADRIVRIPTRYIQHSTLHACIFKILSP